MISWLIGWLDDWPIDWLSDWLIDWLINWLIDWLIEWLTDRLIEWLIDWVTGLIDWLNDWFIDWLIDWLIEWLTNRLMEWLIDWLTDWLIDWLIGWLIVWLFFKKTAAVLFCTFSYINALLSICNMIYLQHTPSLHFTVPGVYHDFDVKIMILTSIELYWTILYDLVSLFVKHLLFQIREICI